MTDTKSLDPIRKPLIQQTLLHHKESVQSWMDGNIRRADVLVAVESKLTLLVAWLTF